MADDLSQLTQLTATTQTTNTITKAQREEVEALFNLVDTDGSGEIDEDELEELFALVGVDVSPEEISEVMREADADGSGEIDREEFAEVMLALPPCRHSPNEVLRCFRLLAGPRAPRNGRMEHAQLIHALVNLGNSLKPGARILIHEATFDDSASMRREAEQRRIGSRTREGRRAPSPEPLPVEEEEEVPSPVVPKKTSRRQRGQKKKKNRRRDDSSDDDGPRAVSYTHLTLPTKA